MKVHAGLGSFRLSRLGVIRLGVRASVESWTEPVDRGWYAGTGTEAVRHNTSRGLTDNVGVPPDAPDRVERRTGLRSEVNRRGGNRTSEESDYRVSV